MNHIRIWSSKSTHITTNIIINKGDNWDIHASMFGDGKTFIKDEIINGFQVIYYESGWGPDEQGNMSSNLYKCEADKNKIYQCDIPVKK